MKKYNSGIYKIQNLLDRKIYFGGGILKAREYYNFYGLKRNIHHNSNLQKAYNKDGKENFEFITLLYCEPDELIRYEQFFVDKYRRSGLLYNIYLDDVSRGLGTKRPYKVRQRMSIAKNGKYNGVKNPFYGMKHTDETKARISEATRGINSGNIIKKKVILKIRKMLIEGLLQKDIMIKLNISRGTIYRTKIGFYDKIYNLPKKQYTPKAPVVEKNDILKVRDMLASGMFQKDVAQKINRSESTIRKIKNGDYDKKYGLTKIKWINTTRFIKKEIVLCIIKKLNLGITQKNIAKQLNISQSTISKVKRGFYNNTYNLEDINDKQ